jgi:hypothetical protein
MCYLQKASLEGALRRSNPVGRGVLDCFVAVSSPHSSAGVIASFQFRYETVICNGALSRTVSLLRFFSGKRSCRFRSFIIQTVLPYRFFDGGSEC